MKQAYGMNFGPFSTVRGVTMAVARGFQKIVLPGNLQYLKKHKKIEIGFQIRNLRYILHKIKYTPNLRHVPAITVVWLYIYIYIYKCRIINLIAVVGFSGTRVDSLLGDGELSGASNAVFPSFPPGLQ